MTYFAVSFIMLAITIATACDGEVEIGPVGGGSGGAGAAGERGEGGSDCNGALLPCQAYPEWDYQCEGFEGAPHHLGCSGMRAVSAECVFIANCTDCLDWCCPPEPWEGPTYADLWNETGGSVPALPGCERQSADDFACAAQGKPPNAVYCPGFDDDNYPDGDCVGSDCCIGNPYGNNSCNGPDEGYFCCPAP